MAVGIVAQVNEPASSRRYTPLVAATTVVGIGVPNEEADCRRQAIFYVRCASARLHWAGLGRGAFGLAGPFLPVSQPRLVPTHPV